MRIRRLNLLRYGHFTDAPIDLPSGQPDIQIVLGTNEAGKSTAMAAIEDLLFGIPSNSPRNFLHDYGVMRVGAVLENDGHSLNVRRRKGNKDTLLSEDEVPFPAGDGALASFIAGADRRFYTRMFSLDHERLRQGGKEILEARDDVGQMLFSVGAGIIGLRERLKGMEAEADALWASRRAAHRKYFQAEDRLKAAESSLRDHIVTAGKWQELRDAFESAGEAYQTIEEEIESKATELRKLTRIRRVCRDVRKRSETDTTIRGLGEIVSLPEDASALLEKAAADDTNAATRIATLTEQIETLQNERAALTYDDALLLRSDDIRQLHERRIQVRAGKIDLPKRLAELASAEASLKRFAAELEWKTDNIDQVIARIPARSKVASVRTLLNRRGEQLAAVENAKATAEEARERSADLTAQIEELGAAVDISKLAAVIKATRDMGDIGARITNADHEAQNARAASQRRLKSLKPEIIDEEALASVLVPPLDTIQAHRDARRNLEQRLKTCRERIRSTDQELTRHKKAYERITSDEQVIAPGELQHIREHRDAGWSIIRRRYVDNTVIPEDEVRAFTTDVELPDAYEAAVLDADKAADKRFDKAEAAARLVVITRQIDEQEDLLETLNAEELAISAEDESLTAEWNTMWAATPIEPQEPDSMIEWLRSRAEILTLIEQRLATEQIIATLRQQEAAAKTLVRAELNALGIDSAFLAEQPFHVVIESATGVERQHESSAKTRRDLDEALRKATNDANRKQKLLEKANVEWTEWSAQWAAALTALHLPANSTPETADAQLNVIDDLREFAGRINDLRHERIEKIERDISAFENDVTELVQAIAPQLAGIDAEDAVLDLERLSAEGARVRDLVAANDLTHAGLQKRADECQESRRDARDIIDRFQRTAGVSTIDELRIAIEQSDRLRILQTEYNNSTERLSQDGDGLSIADLTDECAAIDIDQISAREQVVTQELEELRNRLMEARESRANTRREFEAIGGDDRASRDAADRQAALAEIREIAERYVRLRSATLLLQWAIDRYRREKQAPMLKRAGELFAILTGCSFESLQLEFDQQDNVHLAGIRSDGGRVPVSGMSTGTADQLYLALRIAAVEDYLDNAAPLPFVADDLFINFDDERAAAGFRVLGQLAQKTQVLFFTHHQHLLDVAKKALGPTVFSVSLPAHIVGPGIFGPEATARVLRQATAS